MSVVFFAILSALALIIVITLVTAARTARAKARPFGSGEFITYSGFGSGGDSSCDSGADGGGGCDGGGGGD